MWLCIEKDTRDGSLYASFACAMMVEVTGLEPTTSWSRTKRATKLRYTSLYSQRLILYNIYFFLASVLHLIFTFFKILRRAKIVAGF